MQAKIEETEEEHYIVLPQQVIDYLKIKEGDNITWVIDGKNVYLRKK